MGHILTPGFCAGCDGCEGERGERGKRGKRGHRGHDGHDGHDGDTGPTGPTGPSGPAGPTGPTGPVSGEAPILAVAHVAADGTVLANTGFSSITHIGAGYQLTLASPPVDSSKVVPVVTADSPAAITVPIAQVVAGVITVQLSTGAHTATAVKNDSAFFIVVSQGA